MHTLQSIPDTTSGMIAGYVLMVGIGLVYVVSLVVRRLNLAKDLKVLAQLQEEDSE